MKKSHKAYKPRASLIPPDVIEAFADNFRADKDMGLTFAIWQGIMLAVSGSRLDRHDFDVAWRLWSRQPRAYPLMTFVVDVEENMADMIMALDSKRKLAA